MAASLPVVCTAAGDARAIVDHGVTGYVTELGDAVGLTEHLVALSRPGGERRKLGQAGRRRVETQYAYGNLAAKLAAIHCAVEHGQQRKSGRAPVPL